MILRCKQFDNQQNRGKQPIRNRKQQCHPKIKLMLNFFVDILSERTVCLLKYVKIMGEEFYSDNPPLHRASVVTECNPTTQQIPSINCIQQIRYRVTFCIARNLSYGSAKFSGDPDELESLLVTGTTRQYTYTRKHLNFSPGLFHSTGIMNEEL